MKKFFIPHRVVLGEDIPGLSWLGIVVYWWPKLRVTSEYRAVQENGSIYHLMR